MAAFGDHLFMDLFSQTKEKAKVNVIKSSWQNKQTNRQTVMATAQKKGSFTLDKSKREREFFVFVFFAVQCDWILYEPIWRLCRFRANINEPQ